jgi:hypothetical protein
LSTFLINIFYLFKYSLNNLIFFSKESINDEIINNEIITQVNKNDINLPKKDSDERFYE